MSFFSLDHTVVVFLKYRGNRDHGADGQPLEFGYVDGDYSETTAYSYDALGNMLSYHSVMYGQEYYLFRSYDYAAGSYTECTNEPYYGGMA